MPLTPALFHTLYDAAAQPVLLVQDGVVAACSAAAQHTCAAGRTLQSLLPPDEPLPPLDAPALLPLQLPGGRCVAAAQPVEGDLLLFLPMPETPPKDLAALSRTAQALSAPLSTMTAAASALLAPLAAQDDPALQHSLSEVCRAYYQLLRISGSLSEFSRTWQGGVKLSLERTELSAFLEPICQSAGDLLRQAGRTLVYTLPAAPMQAFVDTRQLRRAVLAILSNAVKFSAPGSDIQLSLTRARKRAVLRIADSGDGMDTSALAAAFHRYAQPPQPGDPRIGMGFSLPMAQAVAQAHGGSLLLQQLQPSGLEVCLTLPLGAPSDALLLKSPFVHMDHTGGFSPELVELSDALPPDCFDARNFL